jgi:hypothetical protein
MSYPTPGPGGSSAEAKQGVFAESFIQAIAALENTYNPAGESHSNKQERRIGRMIARGCIDLTQEEPRPNAADSRFTRAYQQGLTDRYERPERYFHTPSLSVLPEIALSLLVATRTKKRSNINIGAALHKQVARSIGHILNDTENCRYADPANDPGALAELATVALISRSKNTARVMLPALLHHNENGRDTTRGFDAMLTEQEGDTLSTLPIQVKMGCFGLCDNIANAPAPTSKFLEKVARYEPPIRVVSGCCDLQMPRTGEFFYGDNSKAYKYSLTIPYLLHKEATQGASALETEILDLTSTALLQAIHTPDRFS